MYSNNLDEEKKQSFLKKPEFFVPSFPEICWILHLPFLVKTEMFVFLYWECPTNMIVKLNSPLVSAAGVFLFLQPGFHIFITRATIRLFTSFWILRPQPSVLMINHLRVSLEAAGPPPWRLRLYHDPPMISCWQCPWGGNHSINSSKEQAVLTD